MNHFALSQFDSLPKHCLSVSGLSLGLQNSSLPSAQATCLVSTPLPHSAEHWIKDKETRSVDIPCLTILPFRLLILPWTTIPSRAKEHCARSRCAYKARIRRFSESRVCWTRNRHHPTWCMSPFCYEFPFHKLSSTEIVKARWNRVSRSSTKCISLNRCISRASGHFSKRKEAAKLLYKERSICMEGKKTRKKERRTGPQAPTSHLGVSCWECMCLNSGPFVQAGFVQVSTLLRSGGCTHAPAATRIVKFAFSSCTHSNFRLLVPMPQLTEHSPHGSALHLQPRTIRLQI